MTNSKSPLALALLIPSVASAHPGHSSIPSSSPFHHLLAHSDGMTVVALFAALGIVTGLAVLMRWAERSRA